MPIKLIDGKHAIFQYSQYFIVSNSYQLAQDFLYPQYLHGKMVVKTSDISMNWDMGKMGKMGKTEKIWDNGFKPAGITPVMNLYQLLVDISW